MELISVRGHIRDGWGDTSAFFHFFCFIWFLLITKQMCKFYAHSICSELYLYLIIGNQADRRKVLSPSELTSTICNFHSWSLIPSISLWAKGEICNFHSWSFIPTIFLWKRGEMCNFHSWSFIPSIFLWARGEVTAAIVVERVSCPRGGDRCLSELWIQNTCKWYQNTKYTIQNTK